MDTPRFPHHRDCEALTGITLDHLPRDGSLGRVRRFAKGAYVWQPDDAADRIYFLRRMPELNGLEATREIRSAVPAKILILTVHESEQVVTEVLDAGADGYVLKTDAGRTLVEAIRALLQNQRFFTERVRTVATRPAGRRRGAAATRGSARLTARQREVLQLLTEGRSNKEIGAMLGMTTKTAETHRTQIMARLNLHSMSALVRYAIRNRIIEP
jgi:DNA-binding NarL/FixJ family response regulator